MGTQVATGCSKAMGAQLVCFLAIEVICWLLLATSPISNVLWVGVPLTTLSI